MYKSHCSLPMNLFVKARTRGRGGVCLKFLAWRRVAQTHGCGEDHSGALQSPPLGFGSYLGHPVHYSQLNSPWHPLAKATLLPTVVRGTPRLQNGF